MQPFYIPYTDIEKTLSQESVPGKRQLEPFKAAAIAAGAPIQILEDTQIRNDAEVHRHEGDLWIAIDGEVEFIVGGAMVDPWAKQIPDGGNDDRELKAKEIEGGTSHTLKAGDILWIPAGCPHAHHATGTARLYIIKIPTIREVPLDEVPGWKKEVFN